MINDLLDFGRIGKGELKLTCLTFDLENIVEDVIDLFVT